jgi:flagellar export protein FliJ
VKRYTFRLARVLRVRRLQEELLRAAWLEARARADAARAAEGAQARELGLARAELARLQGAGALDPSAVLTQQDLCARSERELARLATRARTLEAEAARRADALREARTAVRGLERLDERRRRGHREESERREQLATDEVAARRFASAPSSPEARAVDEDHGSLPHPAP